MLGGISIMEKIKEIATKVITAVKEGAKALVAKVDLFIMSNPKKATLVALAVGVVLGLLWADLENPVRH